MAIATYPRHSWNALGWLHAAECWLASLRFVAAPIGRDPRLDLMRGFCVFAMIVDHVGGSSWLYALTGGNRGPVTAAEGFVFLSGLVLGIVSRRRVLKEGLGGAVKATLARAWTLYALTVALTLIFVGLTVGTSLALWVDRSLLGEISSWVDLVAATVLLRFTWHGTDILALYALLLGAAPLALLLLVEGKAWRLLAGSWALWLLYQVAPERAVLPWVIEHASTFPFAAWQALFITALVIGYHREEIAAWFARESSHPHGAGFRVGLGMAALALLFLGFWINGGPVYAASLSVPPLSTVDPFDKASLGIGRVLAFAGVAILTYCTLSLFWRPIAWSTGWLLIPLGQSSLYAYALHLFLILVAYNVPPYVGSEDPSWALHNTIGQLLLVLLAWAMVKRRVLFGLIPR